MPDGISGAPRRQAFARGPRIAAYYGLSGLRRPIINACIVVRTMGLIGLILGVVISGGVPPLPFAISTSVSLVAGTLIAIGYDRLLARLSPARTG